MPSPLTYAHVDYTASGTSANFAITFPYLHESDISVSLNGVDTTAFSFLNSSTVQMTSVPAAGVVVRVKRTTPIAVPEIDFIDGSTLTGTDLDTETDQLLFAIQELYEQIADLRNSITTPTSGNLPTVTTANNGQVLQVVGGVWTLVPTSTVTVVYDEQVDGTAMKLQKKTVALQIIGSAPTASGWIDVHTGTAC
jgi:hypothetical protein